jgi:uncharacterized protein YqeY
MSNLKEKIKNDLKDAMRAKDTAKRDTLRNITAMIKQVEVDERRELSDADIEKILMKYAKQREEAAQMFKEANRKDLVEKEMSELKLIKSYLPEPLSDEELEEILKGIISDTQASSMKDMGRVMAKAKEVIGSRADGGRISKVVKSLLS